MATIILGIALGLGALNGLRRGAIKEGMALIGVLLGALLAQGWAATWAAQPSATRTLGHSLGERALTLGLLIGVALFSGYGSGVLIPQRGVKPTVGQRLGGALLGFANIGILAGFALLFIQRLWYDVPLPTQQPEVSVPSSTQSATLAPGAGSWILRTPLTRYLVDRLGLILAGLAIAFAILSIVVMIVRLIRLSRRATPVPAVKPSSASTLSTAASRPTTTITPTTTPASTTSTPQPTPTPSGSMTNNDWLQQSIAPTTAPAKPAVDSTPLFKAHD